MCKIIDLTDSGPISALPLGQTVLGYTLFFVLYILIKYQLFNENIGFVIIMILLISGDMLWNNIYNCSDMARLLLALIIGSLFGISWALLIEITQKQTKIDISQFNNLRGSYSPNCILKTNPSPVSEPQSKTYSCMSLV